MSKSIGYYRQKLHDRGIGAIIASRLHWYKERTLINNWWIGRLIELTGNKIRIDGVVLSVNNRVIPTEHKSTMFFGSYEPYERQFSKRYLDRSLPTIELGGCIGGVSCIVNKMLDDPTAHVVVECSPAMLPTLHENRKLNDAKFTVEPVALAYGTETVSFGVADWMWGSLYRNDRGQVTVPASTLSKLLDKYKFNRINLISDCEGAEIGLTDHELSIMRDRVKWFIAEMHPDIVGKAAVDKMLSDLQSVGFVVRDEFRGTIYALENTRI